METTIIIFALIFIMVVVGVKVLEKEHLFTPVTREAVAIASGLLAWFLLILSKEMERIKKVNGGAE